MLLNKRPGSYFFLAALLTDLELPTDAPFTRRPLRHLHRLPRRLPDGGLPAAVRPRRPPLHQLPDHRAARPDPRRAAAGHRRLALRLRRLPGRLPLEPLIRRTADSRRIPAAPELDRSTWPVCSIWTKAEFRRRFRHTPLWRAQSPRPPAQRGDRARESTDRIGVTGANQGVK